VQVSGKWDALEFKPTLADTTGRVPTLSRIRALAATAALLGFLPLVLPAGALSACSGEGQAQPSLPGKSASHRDLEQLFKQGEIALHNGDLANAERSFRAVLALDPQAAGAYANLGVIAMRRKQWPQSLVMLRRAEALAPQVAGIRLNIGLVHYRQNDFRHAIPPLESVVRDEPDSSQARYLLGLCYFFTNRWVEAVDTLEPLWPQQSGQLNYLYVLGIAADKAERAQLSERALARLQAVGGDSAEFRLLMGKAKLNEEAYEDAVQELTAAAQLDPRLPFVHFNLGLAYSKKGDYERAKDEFLKDIALDPDVAFDYDELGNVYFLMERDADAAKSYLHALQLNPQLLTAHLGLARVRQRQGQYQKALDELDAAAKLDPQSERIHYLRGQILIRMGRKEEGKKELETSVLMSSASRERRQKEIEGDHLPQPELTQEPR